MWNYGKQALLALRPLTAASLRSASFHPMRISTTTAAPVFRLLGTVSVLALVVLLPTLANDEPPKPSDLTGLHIALDVGHSLSKPGAISARGQVEFVFNQGTARVIAGVLRSAGAKVTILNEDGTITGLAERPQLAARAGADAFISIHHDSVNDKYLKTWDHQGQTLAYCDRFSGYSVFCSELNLRAAQSRNLALEAGKAMLAAGFKPTLHHHEPIAGENRPLIDESTGVYEFTELVVAKSGKLPSILLECGVIVHRDEELIVQTVQYQTRIGHALVAALASARDQKIIGRHRLRLPSWNAPH